MPNMKQTISAHNKQILRKNKTQEDTKENNRECNCRNPAKCPIAGKCLTKSVVYQATVTREDNNKMETYIGHTENTFKTRHNGHKSSFNNKQYRNATALSQYVWKLKDSNTSYSIHWKILKKCKAYSTASKRCNLCITEKYFIICRPDLGTLNSRNELTTPCRHRTKYLLCNIKQ